MKNTKLRIASAVMSACLVMSTAAVAGTVNAAADSSINAALSDSLAGLSRAEVAPSRDNIIAFIERLYNVCLDREGDPAGMNYWADELIGRRATGVSAAYGFIMSEEFQNKNCSQEEFLGYMYAAFFGRDAAAAEIDYWIGQMNGGMSREEVFAGFANSQEFAGICDSFGVVRGDYFVGGNLSQAVQVNLFVDRLYTNVLQRTCDANGMTYWTQELIAQRLTGSGVAMGFVFSEEFLGRNLCNEHYVRVLYAAFMGRDYDDGELQYWVDNIEHGKTREEVFNDFVASAEFTGICSSYGIMRGDPNAEGNTVPSGECTMNHNHTGFTPYSDDHTYDFVGDYALIEGFYEDNTAGYVLIDRTGAVVLSGTNIPGTDDENWGRGEGAGWNRRTTNVFLNAVTREVRNTNGDVIKLERIGIDANQSFSIRGDMIYWETETSGFSGSTYEYHFYNTLTKKTITYKPDHKMEFTYRGDNMFSAEINNYNDVFVVIYGNTVTASEYSYNTFDGFYTFQNGYFFIVQNRTPLHMMCVNADGEVMFDDDVANESSFESFEELLIDNRYTRVTSDGVSFWWYATGQYTFFVDFDSATIKDFQESDFCDNGQLKPGYGYDGVFAVPVAGRDGNEYVALIDMDSNFLMDPVRYSSFAYIDGKLYVTPLDGGLDVYDTTGHLVSSSNSGESLDYTSMVGGFVNMEGTYFNATTREPLVIHFTDATKPV